MSPVADDFGAEIIRRREAVGLDQAALAREAGVGRTTLHNIEAGGSPRATTRLKLMRALEAAEAESGVVLAASQTPEVEMIEFQVEGDFGVKVTVRGPVADHETLRADVAEIIRSIRENDGRSTEGQRDVK